MARWWSGLNEHVPGNYYHKYLLYSNVAGAYATQELMQGCF